MHAKKDYRNKNYNQSFHFFFFFRFLPQQNAALLKTKPEKVEKFVKGEELK